MHWKKYYTNLPGQFEESDFLRQVGKTISGQPITQVQLAAQISDIRQALNISRNDHVLDICCGNGIITSEISKSCKNVVGIDFSESLIRIAKIYNNPGNIDYHCISVLDSHLNGLIKKAFTKIYMYEGLQYIVEDDLPILLERIKDVSNPNTLTFLGGIPDRDRIWDFYNTEKRKEDYRKRKSEGQEAIGTWWGKYKLIEVCYQNGFDCEILMENELVHFKHYRFDVRLQRKDRL